MCTIQATIVSILAVTHQQVVWKQPVITWLMYYDLGIFLYMNYAILLIYIFKNTAGSSSTVRFEHNINMRARVPI